MTQHRSFQIMRLSSLYRPRYLPPIFLAVCHAVDRARVIRTRSWCTISINMSSFSANVRVSCCPSIISVDPRPCPGIVIQYARPMRKDVAAARSREMAENRSPHSGRYCTSLDQSFLSVLMSIMLLNDRPSREGSRHPVVVQGLSSKVRWPVRRSSPVPSLR